MWPHHTSSPQYFHLTVRALLINALLGHVGGGHGGHGPRMGNQQSGSAHIWIPYGSGGISPKTLLNLSAGSIRLA
jgi:hypothetical protein